MTSLSKTIARLAAARAGAPGAAMDHLADAPPFRPNPGALRARAYVPGGLVPGAPLVVVLHGCTQTAAGFDRGAGWSTLAEREGFALLFPEQVRANNANLCFNWFEPGDIGRTGGEAESIAAMVEAMLAAHGLDRKRVFVTGLSAGGAMAAVMLAAYPELFAGGAIIGGLPYGCASGVPEALAQMRATRGDDAALAAAVRRAAKGHAGPWPTVSLWHGAADATVDVSNMERSGRQWREVHGIADAVPRGDAGPGWTRRTWRGEDGRDLVEEWTVAGMGHGVPIDPSGPERLGVGGAYMLDVGLSSTATIARSWGLLAHADIGTGRSANKSAVVAPALGGSAGDGAESVESEAVPPRPTIADGVQGTIERALRSAGLMR